MIDAAAIAQMERRTLQNIARLNAHAALRAALLQNFHERAPANFINCGAIREEEALATGLTLEEIRGRSFVKILEKRRA